MIRILFGPTASGKSSVALEWAQKNQGTIINADALQIYDALPILTAQPAAQEMAAVPHRLYGCCDPRTSMNAADWAVRAAAEIAAADNPVLVGGTGMYLTSLLDGMAPIPPTPPEIRAQVESMHAEHGGRYLHKELKKIDPVAAENIDENNKQRVIRAYEVWLATGRMFSAWHDQPKIKFLPDNAAVKVIVLAPEKEWVQDRAATRFDAMLKQGVLDEVASFAQDRGTDNAATQALGFKPLWAHIQGEISLDEARAQTVQDTKSYIKRQMTWGRQQMIPRPHSRTARSPEEALQFLA